MSPRLAYLFFGLVSNAALRLYWMAPRSGLQDELITIHRWALKRAHHARMRDPREREAEP